MGCFWFMSAQIDGFTPDCWVVRRGILNEDIMTKYLNSVYWAFTTVTTVGYGDIFAFTQLEMILAITWMITGVGFYSFTIGSLSSFLLTIDTRDSILNAKLAATHEFAKETGISAECKRRITAVVTYNTSKMGTIWSDKHSLFQELPNELRYEVATTMYNGIATEIPFLNTRNSAFVVHVMPLLKPLKLPNEDYLYKEGDYATEVSMLIKGRGNLVLGKSEIVYKSFLKGSYLGDIEIIFRTLRLDTVQIFGDTEFLTLSKAVTCRQDFLDVLKEFPVDARDFRKIAREKRLRNKKAKHELIELLRVSGAFNSADSKLRPMSEKPQKSQNTEPSFQHFAFSTSLPHSHHSLHSRQFEGLQAYHRAETDYKKLPQIDTTSIGIKIEGGQSIARNQIPLNTTQFVEPELYDDEEEKLHSILTDVKATSDCVNDLRDRTTLLEARIDELLNCFRGTGVQASMVSRLLKRKQKRASSKSGTLQLKINGDAF